MKHRFESYVSFLGRELRTSWSSIIASPFWCHFHLVASAPASASIFGFAEYLAALALLLVVATSSDFRYRYRLLISQKRPLTSAFLIALIVGLGVLGTDVWYENHLPVPEALRDANNLKGIFAAILLFSLCRLAWIAILHPPLFTKRNSLRFYRTTYRFIHQGDMSRMQTIAEELTPSLNRIMSAAAKVKNIKAVGSKNHSEQQLAYQTLLLMGDQRFCRVVADKVPAFAIRVFLELRSRRPDSLPIFQFARNVASEFIINSESAFYQEESGYQSGLFGYEQPITTLIFGSHAIIESCTIAGASPLEIDWRSSRGFGELQFEGYTRACLACVESYLEEYYPYNPPDSTALARMWSLFENMVRDTSQLGEKEGLLETLAYKRLQDTASFVRKVTDLCNKHLARPYTLPLRKDRYGYILDDLARLIFEMIFATSGVQASDFNIWQLQYNTVWQTLDRSSADDARSAVGYKVRRLIWDEIKKMDSFPNYRGAGYLGFCLNVLGLRPISKCGALDRRFESLQRLVLRWTKANFKRLWNINPRLGARCLQGFVTFDEENHRLVSGSVSISKDSPKEYLRLDW